jgi:hypothetical protein
MSERGPRNTVWIAVALVAGAMSLLLVAVVVWSGRYSLGDGFCDEVDLTPVFDLVEPGGGTDHRGGDARAPQGQVCEYGLGAVLSVLRLTVEVHPFSAQAKSSYDFSVDFQESSDLVPHDPFEFVAEAAGPWRDGMIYVGDVFASSDYNVRLKVHDRNLVLQVDLILRDVPTPGTYSPDEEHPVAVTAVAANALEALS